MGHNDVYHAVRYIDPELRRERANAYDGLAVKAADNFQPDPDP